jgi:hypothetical protein
MPGYSPLPRIELDPRTEAELVKAAARRVYEASNSTINDFSSGSPIMALLEGQAFAQSEFLQFANQFPEAVLVEWIGPFLGAQRRTGSGSTVDLKFVISPRNQQFEVFEGYQVTTDSNLTGGESFKFITTERLTIPTGESEGLVRAISLERGSRNNVPKDTIVRSLTSLAGVESITNPEPATNGMDPESLSEVKERFFSLIRRRNPVSSEDWLDFFTDALGPGTSCVTRSRQSERDFYRYTSDYVTANPAVSFFLLNPNGSPLTQAQRDALQTLVKWSLPTEFLGYVYSMEVDEIDFEVNIEYDTNRPYAQNLGQLSQTIRNNLFTIMTPNAVFPIEHDLRVADVESALSGSFPLTLGIQDRYTDPVIQDLKSYFTPQNVSQSSFLNTHTSPFVTGPRVKEDDLIVDYGDKLFECYRATQDFQPTTNDKAYNVNVGNLNITLIKTLTPGPYQAGDVFAGEAGDLYVVLTDFAYSNRATLGQLIRDGFISSKTVVTDWSGLLSPFDENGNYDPDLVMFDQEDTTTVVAYPSNPVDLPKSSRPGSPIYVVAKEFVVSKGITTVGGAKTSGLVENKTSVVRLLEDGMAYSEGSYIKTPDPSELSSGSINTDTCYLTSADGASRIVAKVEKTFTFSLNGGDYSAATENLIESKVIKQVSVVPFIDCRGVATFSAQPFRYNARFSAGEYLRYREKGGFDAKQLEDCVKLNRSCENLTGTCKFLIEENLPVPRYFISLKDFTPNSSDVQEMMDNGFITEVSSDLFESDYHIVISDNEKVFSSTITKQLLESGQVQDSSLIDKGVTTEVLSPSGIQRGVYEWNGQEWAKLMPSLPVYRDMFRFAPGDIASFRNISQIRNFVARKHVTPLMEIDPYLKAGVFEETLSTETTKWIDPLYKVEDIILHTNKGSKSFYRAIKSFSPSDEKTVWNGTVVDNTPRIEEALGSVLKIVDFSDCLSTIRSRLPNHISALKLGRCNLNLRSKTTGSALSTYVWENTDFSESASVLSHSPLTDFKYKPVNYGTGTLAL